MEKKDLIDRIALIIKNAYKELDLLSREVAREQLIEDKMMAKLNKIEEDVAVLKKQLIG